MNNKRKKKKEFPLSQWPGIKGQIGIGSMK
jgi:hypothetical protein